MLEYGSLSFYSWAGYYHFGLRLKVRETWLGFHSFNVQQHSTNLLRDVRNAKKFWIIIITETVVLHDLCFAFMLPILEGEMVWKIRCQHRDCRQILREFSTLSKIWKYEEIIAELSYDEYFYCSGFRSDLVAVPMFLPIIMTLYLKKKGFGMQINEEQKLSNHT
jgi:hypothetical protein